MYVPKTEVVVGRVGFWEEVAPDLSLKDVGITVARWRGSKKGELGQGRLPGAQGMS